MSHIFLSTCMKIMLHYHIRKFEIVKETFILNGALHCGKFVISTKCNREWILHYVGTGTDPYGPVVGKPRKFFV